MLTKSGNILFHYRNILFPVFYAALFIPSGVIFGNSTWAITTGSFVIAAGIITRCLTIGLVYIIRGGRNRTIYAEDLVTDGMYKVCRNPMYLGNILLIAGFGLFANSLLFTLIFTPLFIFFYYLIICAEEAFLRQKFGTPFDAFMSSTNTIIPKINKLKEAFEGHTFRFSTVIWKEYNSLFLYFTGILLLLIYKYHLGLIIFAILETILVILYLVIRGLKHGKITVKNS
jgi:protein-S-isoprenylcysteine O-methyltransferase Ste14